MGTDVKRVLEIPFAHNPKFKSASVIELRSAIFKLAVVLIFVFVPKTPTVPFEFIINLLVKVFDGAILVVFDWYILNVAADPNAIPP